MLTQYHFLSPLLRNQIDSNLTTHIKSPITFPKRHRTKTLPTTLQHFSKTLARQWRGRINFNWVVVQSARKILICFPPMRKFHSKTLKSSKCMVCCNPAVSQWPSPQELFSRSWNIQPPASFQQAATSAALDSCSKSASELAAGLAWQVEGDGHEGGILLPQLVPPEAVSAEPSHLQRPFWNWYYAPSLSNPAYSFHLGCFSPLNYGPLLFKHSMEL